jgi:pyruvate dehydrogenase E2 component (dihydrolipoamide acetyltransferase)
VTEILMPRLSDSMEEGTVTAWLRSDGAHVDAGDELAEIETDKATITYEAEASGTLMVLAPAGTTLPVGAVLGTLGAATAPPAPSREPEPVAAAPSVLAAAAPGAKATPLARRLAQAHGVALDGLVGTGPRGRVTRDDVAARAGLAVGRAPAARPEAATATPAAAERAGGGKGRTEVVELTRRRLVVARRMAQSAAVPAFQVSTDAAVDGLLALRAQLKEAGLTAPSLNDLVVKAAALALREHPRVNGSFRDDRVEQYERINVGIAVATDDALVVPTIFDADRKSLGTIAADARRLSERVRRNEAAPAELADATFTVSNLGMYGMTAIAPLISTPQAAILGVGTVAARPALRDGALVERHHMTLTLSCDHRILDGVEGARYLSAVRGLLEQPLSLTL